MYTYFIFTHVWYTYSCTCIYTHVRIHMHIETPWPHMNLHYMSIVIGNAGFRNTRNQFPYWRGLPVPVLLINGALDRHAVIAEICPCIKMYAVMRWCNVWPCNVVVYAHLSVFYTYIYMYILLQVHAHTHTNDWRVQSQIVGIPSLSSWWVYIRGVSFPS